MARPMVAGDSTFSYAGVASKVGVLFLILLATAGIGVVFPIYPLAIAAMVGVFIIAFIAYRKPDSAPVLAPVAAVLEGYFVGVISLLFMTMNAAQGFGSVVPMAIGGTLAVFLVMLTLYTTRIIRMSQTLLLTIVGATSAVMIVYISAFVASFFWPGVTEMPIFKLQGAGPVGIGFSILVLIIASFNLAVDFHLMEQNVAKRTPKKYEWVAALALMITIVWIYIEMLRLLTKIYNR